MKGLFVSMEKNELIKFYDSHSFEEQFKYEGKDLGVTLHKNGTTFKVWSPVAKEIKLNLFKNGHPNEKAITSYKMEKGENGVYFFESDKDLTDFYYTYSVTSMGKTFEVVDIYAKACGVNGRKGMVVDLEKTNPKDWDKDNFSYDSNLQPIIYELHIKDFSYDKNSGISKENRGKYLAFTENTGKNTCMNYLKDLGVTHVHILPMYDFGSVDENGDGKQFNWGYDPVNYNVPEGSYSSNPKDGNVRINELKQMVKALHDANIGVIMDVVYNHTYDVASNFHHTVPYYYHRTKDGEFSNGSACGNETASERFMFRKFMVDSVLYWAKEYHLDGFRFDLMGLHDTVTMNLIREELDKLPNGKSILMYGEPWFADTPAMAKGAVPATKDNIDMLDTNIAIFSDDTRDAIKGSVFYEEVCGYVNGKQDLSTEIKSAVTAWCDSDKVDVRKAKQIISYVPAHDNFTLYDKLAMSMSDNVDFEEISKEILQLNKFCATIYFTCGGGIFFQAGEEFARTKKGEGDSYKSSPKLNMLDWTRAEENSDLVEFYKNLIKFRKSVTILSDKNIEISSHFEFIKQKDSNIVSFIINDGERKIFVAYNPNFVKKTIKLPKGEWKILLDGEKFVSEEVFINSEFKMAGSTGIIFAT